MKSITLSIFFLVVVVSSAKLDNNYLPPNSAKTAGGNGNILVTPVAGYGTPVSTQYEGKYTVAVDNHHQPAIEEVLRNPAKSHPNAPTIAQKHRSQLSPVYGPAHQNNFQQSSSPEAHTNILRFDNSNDGNGNYHFDFETENKIRHEEQGQLKQVADGEAVVVQGSYSYIGDDGKTYTVTYIADENGFQPTGEHIDEAISRTASEAARSAVPDSHQYTNGNGNVHFNEQNLNANKNGGYQY